MTLCPDPLAALQAGGLTQPASSRASPREASRRAAALGLGLDVRRDVPREGTAREVLPRLDVAPPADACRLDVAVVRARARHPRPRPVAVVLVRPGGQLVARVAAEVVRSLRAREVPPLL
eukprot:CAMPEP_0205892960 /NCGR_PEP_ID=MMETSP1083-20121108/22977_1 /ASSEMBLY_ACC=CAM_ASM_000430 /TAXON_ID=97485 /ORGANISM="Prymnesium parvum, Strain Texoma1" /LENGTH=119 /DNA_ID=CAMNT_0053257557 /DNA_START=177 /DNA_END=537 /DNA_ORIENTATION=+